MLLWCHVYILTGGSSGLSLATPTKSIVWFTLYMRQKESLHGEGVGSTIEAYLISCACLTDITSNGILELVPISRTGFSQTFLLLLATATRNGDVVAHARLSISMGVKNTATRIGFVQKSHRNKWICHKFVRWAYPSKDRGPLGTQSSW